MPELLPQAIFPGFTSSELGITIPLKSLPSLDKDKAATNAKEVIRAILIQTYIAINALPLEDRPTGMKVTQSNPAAIDTNTIKVGYTITFDLTLDFVTNSTRTISEK